MEVAEDKKPRFNPERHDNGKAVARYGKDVTVEGRVVEGRVTIIYRFGRVAAQTAEASDYSADS